MNIDKELDSAIRQLSLALECGMPDGVYVDGNLITVDDINYNDYFELDVGKGTISFPTVTVLIPPVVKPLSEIRELVADHNKEMFDTSLTIIHNHFNKDNNQMVKKYRKKPVVIEARLLEDNYDSIYNAVEYIYNYGMETSVLLANKVIDDIRAAGGITIKTLEGNMLAKFGDYIIKGINGEFYPCKPDIFAQTYEEVKPEEQPDHGGDEYRQIMYDAWFKQQGDTDE